MPVLAVWSFVVVFLLLLLSLQLLSCFVTQVGVHIADVSHFIRPGTALDKEAASRGTTVYLIDKVLLLL